MGTDQEGQFILPLSAHRGVEDLEHIWFECGLLEPEAIQNIWLSLGFSEEAPMIHAEYSSAITACTRFSAERLLVLFPCPG